MRIITSLLIVACFISCSSPKGPDISGITVDLQTQRFEKDLFALDTTKLMAGLESLNAKYPSFTDNFLYTILNTDPRWQGDTAENYIRSFVSAYRPVYDTAEKVFNDFTKYESEIETSVKYLKYYFPAYKAPGKIITYIGPLDGYGDIVVQQEAFVVGLHHHLGKNFSMYQNGYVAETYPAYISNRFEPEYIVVNAMKNVINEMYPEKYDDKSLIIQMVENGKRLYLLSRLVPDAAEFRLIGYTEKQLKESYEHERIIWDLFIQNNMLRTNDANMIKNYVGESPKTMELGEASPGNIGSFAGWQIVKKYMSSNENVSLKQMMETDPEVIFQSAKYKP